MGNRSPTKVVVGTSMYWNRKALILGNRMRNAVILVLQLRGVATETIKNVVLAGIGKLIVVDHEDVKEEDLGCGFFFRDEDVGQKVSEL